FLEASSHAGRACDLLAVDRGVQQTPTSSLRSTRWRSRGMCPALRAQPHVESASSLRPERTRQRQLLLHEKASCQQLNVLARSRRRLARGSVAQASSEVRLEDREYACPLFSSSRGEKQSPRQNSPQRIAYSLTCLLSLGSRPRRAIPL